MLPILLVFFVCRFGGVLAQCNIARTPDNGPRNIPPRGGSALTASCTAPTTGFEATFESFNVGTTGGSSLDFYLASGAFCNEGAFDDDSFLELDSVSGGFTVPTLVMGPTSCDDTTCCIWAQCNNDFFSCNFEYSFSLTPPSASPTPSNTPSAPPSPSSSPTGTSSSSNTPSITPSPTASISSGGTPSGTPSPTPSSSMTPSGTPTASQSPGACRQVSEYTIPPQTQDTRLDCVVPSPPRFYRQDFTVFLANPDSGDRVRVKTTTGVNCERARETPSFLFLRDFSITQVNSSEPFSFTGMTFNFNRTCVVLLCENDDLPCTVNVDWLVRVVPPSPLPPPPPRSGSGGGGGLSDAIVGGIIAGSVGALCGGVFACYKYRCVGSKDKAAAPTKNTKGKKSSWEVHNGTTTPPGVVATPNPLQVGAGSAGAAAGSATHGMAMEHGVELVSMAGESMVGTVNSGEAEAEDHDDGVVEEGGSSSVAGSAGKAVGKFVGGFIKGLVGSI